ncbi:hypothetical protein [Ferrimicrobium acidiphilum]|uniref:hypothetical protein n=1 Tax=Ferrimicrobium acidiphilum TaxID=121039 RepID=UPI0023F464F8|nr:hypothetical protein [Ferrimicrobium acidiphilum]
MAQKHFPQEVYSVNGQIRKSSKREWLGSIIVSERRSRRLRLVRNRSAVPGGITNQMIGIAIAAIVLVVGGSYAGSYLSSAHTSATNGNLSAALTAASSVYDQQDSFTALPGSASFGASLGVSDPLLKFTATPGTSSSTSNVVYEAGSGGGTTGQPQSVEFVVPDGNGHCMFALDVESASSTLLTGTQPPGVTQPGTYYAAAPASSGTCSISGVGALPTGAAYPSNGTTMASWLTAPIS